MPPVYFQKKAGVVSVVAEKNLEPGELMVPLFIRRPLSIVMEGEYGADKNKSVPVDVEWTEGNINPHLALHGLEKAETQCVTLIVKEEVRLPNTEKVEDWSGHEELHPFWMIKRQKEGEEINCKMCTQHMSMVTSMEWEGLARQGAKIDDSLGGMTVSVFYPFILNHK